MLNIVKEIKEFGLEAVVEKYNLTCKVKEDSFDMNGKVLLKYHQIDSYSFRGLPAVRECRGLILENNTWNVLSYPFYRFFNKGETHADELDYETARAFKKEDGSLIALYFDWNQDSWCVQTSGTMEALTPVGLDSDLTFKKLFCDTMNLEIDEDGEIHGLELLNQDLNYMFELCTPYNIVVTPHTTCYTKVLAIRNRTTLKELSWNEVIAECNRVGFDPVDSYEFSIDDVVEMAKALPQIEEGYIVCDANHNRIKVKNPAYVALHHLKSKLCKEELFTVIFKGEQDEFLSLFPAYTDMLNERSEWLELLKNDVLKVHIRITANAPEDTKKAFALYLQDLFKTYPLASHFASHFYRMFGDNTSVNMFDVIKETEVKKLEKGFQKWMNVKQVIM